MSVWLRGRKALVKAWSVAFGRTAALAARDAAWDALKLLRQNRVQVEEALQRLVRLEEAAARAAERLDWLARAAPAPAVPLYDHILAARTRAGLAIYVDGRDAGEGAALLANGVIEPGLDRLLPKLMPQGGVFVDVGAHTGYYALTAALIGGERARVHAVEPNPALAPLIARAARANGFADRLTVHACAAGEAGGRATFAADPFASGRGGLAGEGEEVEVAALDDRLEPGLVADVVKLDAGGAEAAALRGMTALLRRSPDVRLIVPHRGGAVELIDELAALGLSVWRVNAAGFLENVAREDLTGAGAMRLVAARRRPDDREIVWKGAADGPEIPLARGRYEAFVEGELGPDAELVATYEGGLALARRRLAHAGERLGFELPGDVRRLRVAARGARRVERLGLRDLT